MRLAYHEVDDGALPRLDHQVIYALAESIVRGHASGTWVQSWATMLPLANMSMLDKKIFLPKGPVHLVGTSPLMLGGRRYFLRCVALTQPDCTFLDQIVRSYAEATGISRTIADGIADPVLRAVDLVPRYPDLARQYRSTFHRAEIHRLEVRNLFGRDHTITFTSNTCLTGMSGSGKSAILQLLAALTGPVEAEDFLTGENCRRKLLFDHVRLEMTDGRSFISGPISDSLSKVWEFKFGLPWRTSYIDETGFKILAETYDPVELISLLTENLNFDRTNTPVLSPGTAEMYPPGSGFTRMLDITASLPKSGAPVLIDGIHRSLHPHMFSHFVQWLDVIGSQKIMTTSREFSYLPATQINLDGSHQPRS